IIVVDGIRANKESQTASITVNAGGQQPSRLNDIDPQDIESMEIVKGPAATTLYGPDAANGVIRITTKRGRAGPPRWTGHSEYGVIDQSAKWPLNYRGINLGSSVASQRTNCQLRFQAAGTCTQDSLSTFQVLSTPGSTPFDRGNRQEHGLTVSGGTDAAQ